MDTEDKWDLIIEPKRKIFDLQIRELIRYRDLIFLFVKRDFVTQYKQTILGPLWYIISPLISTVMYTFVFGRLANIGTDGIPYTLFYYSGTMLWTFFSGCFNDSSNVFINNANIFGKVYFPRLVVPINYVFSNSIKIMVQFVMLMAFFIYYLIIGSSGGGTPLHPSWFMLFFPLLVVWLAAIGVGAGIIISSLTTKYRDLQRLVSFAIGLAMYATPVVYPLSEIPQRFSWVAYANPVCAPIELFRLWFFGSATVSNYMILASLGITVFLVIIGLILFNQNEQNFIDVV
ncbi:MAG: ABC transporter permease [Treponema sp.]|jgi:lipopolysaccharide transport system permease protein|nr:ABC transporter permease [Treponema sp.]